MMKKDKGHSRQVSTWWINLVQGHASTVLIATLLATAAVLLYLQQNFRINTDLNGMISEKLRFQKVEKEFSKAFPQFSDTIVVVIDGDTPEQAVSACKLMAASLRKETGIFKTVYEPGGDDFFEKNGLLYLSRTQLEDLADKLANAQPLIAFLSNDLSLRGLFSVLEMILSHKEADGINDKSMNQLFDGIRKTFDGVIDHHKYVMSWESLMFGEKQAEEQRRQFIVLQPYLDASGVSTEASLEALRRTAKELNIDRANGVNMSITGDVALSYENLQTVKNSTGAATFISLVLVGIIFFVGLGSGRMVFASLLTLVMGLIWTTGFAIAFVGSLNLISITFAVLFIGLGIDYSIQFCLRYKELIMTGYSESDGITTTARGVGRSLLLSCITVAVGFYSFVPTAYAGVAELGLISGSGMFISFFMTITVLPALLTVFRTKKRKGWFLSAGQTLSSIPYKYPRAIITAAVILGLGSIPLLSRVYFDYNPLDLYSKTSESVNTIKELFRNPETQPWTISVLTNSKQKAESLAERLARLKEVKMALTISDFVPDKQSEKLGIISDVLLFMPPDLGNTKMKHLSYKQKVKALNGFERALRASLLSSPKGKHPDIGLMYASVRKFKSLLTDPVKGNRAFSDLEKGLLLNLPGLFKSLEKSLSARSFVESDLPRQLADQFVSADGRYRIQVFPRENIMNTDALKRFVRAVRQIAPDATDSPVTIYESGRAVVSSFKQAILYALIFIILFLLIELRSFYVTALILIPLMFAIALTGAASVLLDIPLNFANVIVVPLLLGIGVHSGIIFILRFLNEPPFDGNMLRTSTARAILFSELTMIVSTGSLSFSPHRGIASMGILLTICLSFLIVSILILLPALIEIYRRRSEKKQ
jgi:hopanoid biosynthesis associated RND transporter like protein HpnN